MRKLPCGKEAQGVAEMIIKTLLPFKNVVKSITPDNGTDFARHQKDEMLIK